MDTTLGFFYTLLFVWVNITVHELGHAAVAWIVRFEFRAISVGPVTVWRDPYGYQWKFEWLKTLETSGYTGAVPTTAEGLRHKQLAVIAAGPLASLGFGLASVGVFLALTGTGWQDYWWLPALNTVVAFGGVATSLLPVGYSDGSMLWHLGLRTAAGELLSGRIMLQKLTADAEAYHQRAEYYKETQLRERALEMMKQGGEGNALAIARCHMQLGHAKLSIDDWPGAAREFLEALKFDAECGLAPTLSANSKALLHAAYVERYDAAEAGPAYAAA